MDIIINKDNLTDGEVTNYSLKVRGIIEKDNNIVVGKYGKVFLLPGGKVDVDEDLITGLIRELKEELGIEYKVDDTKVFTRVCHYKKNYKKRNGRVVNRKVETVYFVLPYKGIDFEKRKLSYSERKYDFSLDMINVDDLKEMLKKENNNVREDFYNSELLYVLNNFYKK